MHEQNSATVAEMCKSTCRLSEVRLEEWPDSENPMETSGAFDGQWLEDSPQSTACEGKCEGCPQTNLESVCLSRNGNPEFQEKPGQSKRLETMGVATGDSGKSLHSESKTRLVGIVRPTGVVGVENVMQLLEYQQYRCALTGRKLAPQTAALDHIVPIRRDGEHSIENTQVLHKDVNRAKGSLTNQEFIQLCQEVVLWPKKSTFNQEIV